MNGPSIKDFSALSVIGKGTYAKVLLVRQLKIRQSMHQKCGQPQHCINQFIVFGTF